MANAKQSAEDRFYKKYFKRGSFSEEYMPVRSGGDVQYVERLDRLTPLMEARQMKVKTTRPKATVRSTEDAAGTRMYLQKANPVPKMPKVKTDAPASKFQIASFTKKKRSVGRNFIA